MSSDDLTGNHSSSPRASGAKASGSQKSPDPAQIPSRLSKAGSIREEPVNISGAAMPSPDLTDNVDPERERRNAEFVFMREVARRNPYIPSVGPPSSQSTGKAGEELTPTLTESWEKVLKEVARYDEDIAKGWQDDIDTLLVFGGLFSAVVTAFVIESYQWLEEDPADTTVTLLNKLILVQVNGPQSISFEPTQFKPDASSIRINVFWFLSLIFSLTSALFGLLCKQWIREQ
ncbi:hypothetical protein WG66_011997 [Moniliophthora roreri]|nr:hypothetical protein WG66_011997 [Moniliophthora roreri]